MSLDTPAKRAAAAGAGLPPGIVLPAPDGSIDAADRAQLAGGVMPQQDAQPSSGAIDDQAFTLGLSHILLHNPLDELTYRIYVAEWLIPNGADLEGATIVADGLTFGDATVDNATSPPSLLVSISDGAHGRIYQARASITFTAGGTLVRPLTIRAFAS